jgi:hypothetical protein
MANDHQPPIPLALEQLVQGLGELEIVIGPNARPIVAGVRDGLIQAMAARDRGDPVEALRLIGTAMEQLATLADKLDPNEAMLMRTVSDRFRSALLRGNLPEAKQGMDVMFDRAGAKKRTED